MVSAMINWCSLALTHANLHNKHIWHHHWECEHHKHGTAHHNKAREYSRDGGKSFELWSQRIHNVAETSHEGWLTISSPKKSNIDKGNNSPFPQEYHSHCCITSCRIIQHNGHWILFQLGFFTHNHFISSWHLAEMLSSQQDIVKENKTLGNTYSNKMTCKTALIISSTPNMRLIHSSISAMIMAYKYADMQSAIINSNAKCN